MKKLLFIFLLLLPNICMGQQVLVGDATGTYYSTTTNVGIGTLNAISLTLVGGTSNKFLKADGSLDSTTYVSGTPWTTTTTVGTLSSLATSGNVGINTTTSPQFLYVKGNGQFTSNGIINGNLGIGTAGVTIPNPLYVVGTAQFTGATIHNGNVGIGTTVAPQSLYVVGNGFFTTGINIGIGTASLSRLCVQNNTVSKCP